ncbi:BTAD domain-containing putative transcriptional regulator [Kribbella sp. NPDC004536]|uniref:AfsR/SARP family transcriptional regulator n=1 Tax=Kribbella sp. NPDC004536 TaxID=3364106 RepID=UPI0036CF3F64
MTTGTQDLLDAERTETAFRPATIDRPDKEVRLLGAVDVLANGRSQEVPGLRRKSLLAALALNAGQVVSNDQLIDTVWSGRAPATVSNTLQSHISYLRRILGGANAILMSSPGYRLNTSLIGTDVQVAERLISESRRTDDLQKKLGHLRTALSLWRGAPLSGVRAHASLNDSGERLERLNTVAMKSMVETELKLGLLSAAIPRLQDMLVAYPFDEELHAQLMLALYRAGRQVEALAVYRVLREGLIAELAIEPSRKIRDLQEAILRQDPSIELEPALR